jgi:hypothetical protein
MIFTEILRMLDSFYHNKARPLLKTYHLSTNLKWLLHHLNQAHYMPFVAWEDYCNFYLDFWVPFAFWEADFYKMKARETLSR